MLVMKKKMLGIILNYYIMLYTNPQQHLVCSWMVYLWFYLPWHELATGGVVCQDYLGLADHRLWWSLLLF